MEGLVLLLNVIFIIVVHSIKLSNNVFKSNVPVWSLATINQDHSTNFNIVTYTSPLSFSPNEVWALSLFKGTLSLENFQREGRGVLQHLTKNQIDLVPWLGKHSGRNIDKLLKIQEHGQNLVPLESLLKMLNGFEEYLVLDQAGVYICLEQLIDTAPKDLGDHYLYLCKNVATYSRVDESIPRNLLLQTDFMRIITSS
jgi:hypothetical protein